MRIRAIGMELHAERLILVMNARRSNDRDTFVTGDARIHASADGMNM
jgi:hypothetical protein